MAGKRIFISFAIEDRNLRDLLVGQRNNSRTAIEFTDFSVKQPWDASWKTQCRSRIRVCSGVIGIITKNTPLAAGQLWEIKCAYQENIPVMLMYGSPQSRPTNVPIEIKGRQIYLWTWDRVTDFIESV